MKSDNRVLFFCGDVIPYPQNWLIPKQKGIILQHIRTLTPHKGLIHQHTFTLLEPVKQIDNVNMLPPDVKGWKPMPNKYRQCGSVFERYPEQDNRVYKWRMPEDDVRCAIEPTPPNGAAGVVEIKALRGVGKREVAQAQKHFFGNGMPKHLSDFPAHIVEKMPNGWGDIGVDLLQSHKIFCDWKEKYMKQFHIDTLAFLSSTGRTAEQMYYNTTDIYYLLKWS